MTIFQWHPTDDGTLLGGLSNGQIVLWDLEDKMKELEAGQCTWDHKKINQDEEGQDWNEDKGLQCIFQCIKLFIILSRFHPSY